jgi:hypothetical protein
MKITKYFRQRKALKTDLSGDSHIWAIRFAYWSELVIFRLYSSRLIAWAEMSLLCFSKPTIFLIQMGDMWWIKLPSGWLLSSLFLRFSWVSCGPNPLNVFLLHTQILLGRRKMFPNTH